MDGTTVAITGLEDADFNQKRHHIPTDQDISFLGCIISILSTSGYFYFLPLDRFNSNIYLTFHNTNTSCKQQHG